MKKILLSMLLLLVMVSCQNQVLDVEPAIQVDEIAPVVQIEDQVEETEPLVVEPSISVWTDKNIFYYNGCVPNHKATFFVHVDSPNDIRLVTLHLRFLDKEGEGITPWGIAYDMRQRSDNEWSITLVGNDLKSFKRHYEFMTLYYQAIAWTTPNVWEVRSDVGTVSFEACVN